MIILCHQHKEELTSDAYSGESSLPIVALPPDISSKAWAGVLAPETSPARTDLQLRVLAAAAR